MGGANTAKPSGTPSKPTRRKVLTVAATAGAGVAASRLLGLRDLDQRAIAATLNGTTARSPMTMGESSMAAAFEPAEPMLELLPEPTPAPGATAAPPPPSLSPSTTPTSSATPRPSPVPARTAAPAAAPARPETVVAPRAASTDWVAPFGTEAGKIGHLLRRTTFGPTRAEHERALAEGYAKTLERILETPAAPPIALADTPAKNLQQLQQWWVDQMIQSPTPFAEAMTLFWHGHFTSDYRKVGMQQPYLYWQNQTWRTLALGDLRTLLKQATVDPAMLRYLDLGISTGRNPNENYARELMELFTMGAGTFTEDDVRAGAKALAGWRLPRANETVQTGVFDRQRAFAGQVTFLGKTGALDADGVIDQILVQDATAPHIVDAVWTTFVSPQPSAAALARLAARFRTSKYDVKALLRDVLTSPEFLAPEAYRALVKSPTELMVSFARVLSAPTLARSIGSAGDPMGQRLFDPPSVAGWPVNGSWISSSTMISRSNFIATALSQVKELPPVDDAHLRVLDGVLAPGTAALLNRTADARQRWSVILSSPEFQLK